jgi:acetylornithine deacetylase/succinyl-diaminopimelate desuccinylase-like protein
VERTCPIGAGLQREGMSPRLFVLCLTLAATALRAAQPVTPPTPHQQLAREIFRELIEINTVAKNGSTKAAEAMAARLRAAGFKDTEYQLIGDGPTHQNLVVRFRGKDPTRKPVLFICHLDVVEALREDWSFDPFVFLEKDGYFYGRGTSDIKNEDAALVAALIRLRQEGWAPARDIVVALTEGEETGIGNGVDWLVQNRRDLIEAELCINPDGGTGEIRNGRATMLELQTSEKTYLAYQLEVTNKGGHGSLPTKDNAIYRLAAGLQRLAAYEFPLNLNETTRLFFERSAAFETDQIKADMLALAKTPADRAAADRLAAGSAFYNAMMRTTAVATQLNGGHAQNALPQKATAVLNARMLPGESADDVMAAIAKAVADDQIKVTSLVANRGSPLSPLRPELVQRVEAVTQAVWPGVVVTPFMATGATDGTYLRRAGIPVYGISGMFQDVDDVRAHGKDERIGVREFYEGAEFTYRLMKALAE